VPGTARERASRRGAGLLSHLKQLTSTSPCVLAQTGLPAGLNRTGLRCLNICFFFSSGPFLFVPKINTFHHYTGFFGLLHCYTLLDYPNFVTLQILRSHRLCKMKCHSIARALALAFTQSGAVQLQETPDSSSQEQASCSDPSGISFTQSSSSCLVTDTPVSEGQLLTGALSSHWGACLRQCQCIGRHGRSEPSGLPHGHHRHLRLSPQRLFDTLSSGLQPDQASLHRTAPTLVHLRQCCRLRRKSYHGVSRVAQKTTC